VTRGLLLIALLLIGPGSRAQDKVTMDQVRQGFQNIGSEDDIQKIIEMPIDSQDPNASTARAYQAASTCMMAEYVFSPIKKLKFFNQGKNSLESLIDERKTVENVYLRLLIQLNIPRLLNYYKNIEEDVAYLEAELPAAKIDVDYKYTMIRNLVTLTKKGQVKEVLLGIKMTGTEEKL